MRSPDDNSGTVIEPTGFTPLDASATDTVTRRPTRLLVVVAVLALFAAAVAFLFSARSVLIRVIAETPAQLSVRGLALPVGERYLLLPGEHRVTAKAPGYKALSTLVNVDERDSQEIELLLQPLPGKVSIDSIPPGATVILDGEPLGQTPLQQLALPAGEVDLLLRHPRYLPLRQQVLVSGRGIQQQLKLELLPAWATVTIDSRPRGAAVLVDGEQVATTPATVEVMEGERQLLLQLDNFSAWEVNSEFVAGASRDFGEIELPPAPGNLQLTSEPAGANVTLDGEFQGQTPLLLQLRPHTEQRVSLSKPGYRRHTQLLSMSAGESRELAVSLRAQLGTVVFKVLPENAVVRVNGERRGRGSQILSLPAVEHRIDITLEGYAPQSRRITPRPGLEQRVEVQLQTEEEASLARLPPQVQNKLGQTFKLMNPAASALGDFTMGASRRDPGRRSNEVLHPVSLRRMFYLQTTEVTNAQFRAFQADHKSGHVEGRSLNRDQQPAVQLSWQQAASYCNWLSRLEGRRPFYREKQGIITGFDATSTGYRLPTEAEWAWAARTSGGELLKFPWGNSFPPRDTVENYADAASAFINGRVLNNYRDDHLVSAPVGSYPANDKGLFDMGGNVAEWVHDVYTIPTSDGSISVDPLGSQSGDNYVIRGASWSQAKLPQLRLSHRDYGQAGRDDVGFRIARYAE